MAGMRIPESGMLIDRFFRRNKDKDPQRHARPGWMKWLLGLFVLYLLLQGYSRGPEGAPRNEVQRALDDAEQSFRNEPAFDFSTYKSRIFPDYGGAVRITEVKQGTGPAAICGQTARIAYKAFLKNGKPVGDEATEKKPLVFGIGSGKAMPVLDAGVVGMRVGGARTLQSPMSMAYGAKGFERNDLLSNEYLRFEVTLLGVSPALPDIGNQLYRVSTVVNGYGPPLTCGHEAHVHLVVWDLTGKKLYSTLPDKPATEVREEAAQNAESLPEGIRFTPGRQQVMYGLEQGVLGMAPGSVRTLIIPPALQKTLAGKAPSLHFPAPDNQTILVDVEYLP